MNQGTREGLNAEKTDFYRAFYADLRRGYCVYNDDGYVVVLFQLSHYFKGSN
jgi:hypothetical protein